MIRNFIIIVLLVFIFTEPTMSARLGTFMEEHQVVDHLVSSLNKLIDISPVISRIKRPGR